MLIIGRMFLVGLGGFSKAARSSIIILLWFILDPNYANLLEDNAENGDLTKNNQGSVAQNPSHSGAVSPLPYKASQYPTDPHAALPYPAIPYRPTAFQTPAYLAPAFNPGAFGAAPLLPPRQDLDPAYLRLLPQQSFYPNAHPQAFPATYPQPAYNPLLIPPAGILPQVLPRPMQQYPAYIQPQLQSGQLVIPKLQGYGPIAPVSSPYQQTFTPAQQTYSQPSQTAFPQKSELQVAPQKQKSSKIPTISPKGVLPFTPAGFQKPPKINFSELINPSKPSLKTPSASGSHRSEGIKIEKDPFLKKAVMKPIRKQPQLQPAISSPEVTLEEELAIQKLIKEKGWWEGWNDVLSSDARNGRLSEQKAPTDIENFGSFWDHPGSSKTKKTLESLITLKVVPKSSKLDIVPTDNDEVGEGNVLNIKVLLPKP